MIYMLKIVLVDLKKLRYVVSKEVVKNKNLSVSTRQ